MYIYIYINGYIYNGLYYKIINNKKKSFKYIDSHMNKDLSFFVPVDHSNQS